MTLWWARHAWLGGSRNASRVRLEVKGDRLATVTPDVPRPPPGAHVLDGLVVPGLANTHSHAFHRALRARTHEASGSFWAWRDLMYEVAGRLDPDSYRALATAVYSEMAMAGFTVVGEFHYLHHGPDGVPYSDPNAMGRALIDAAATAGVRITLLDTCYLEGGFGLPLAGVQRRFGDGSAEAWAERASALRDGPTVRVGAAVHSVRAVPPKGIAAVAGGSPVLHAHVSEQRREVEECRARLGRTPLEVFADAGALGAGFTAVHGTHLTEAEVGALGEVSGGCCLCPTTERDLGDGIGPAVALKGAGVRLSIGTDSHAVIDGFEEARAIELDARLAAEARGLVGPADLLAAATAGGASSLGWESGRIEAGGLADFVELRLDTPRTAGCDPELPATAVFAATSADVATTVVGGRVIVEDGAHVALSG